MELNNNGEMSKLKLTGFADERIEREKKKSLVINFRNKVVHGYVRKSRKDAGLGMMTWRSV